MGRRRDSDEEEGEGRGGKRARMGEQATDESEDAPDFGPGLPAGFWGGPDQSEGASRAQDEGGFEEQTDEEEEEAAQPKLLRDPGDPSPQEIAEHNVTHMPYRAWCAHCVAGRGKADPHRRVAEAAKQEGIPVMSADYAFLGQDDQPDNVTLW